MSGKTYARLTKNSTNLIVEIVKNDNRQVVYTDKATSEKLEKLKQLLGFDKLEEMLTSSRQGDTKVHEMKREFETGEALDFSWIEEEIEKFEKKNAESNYTDELITELKKNHRSDLAAAVTECIFEDFGFILANLLMDLTIDELFIDTKTTYEFERLNEILARDLPKGEIKVKISNKDRDK